jgi:cysteine-rich repeat protein
MVVEQRRSRGGLCIGALALALAIGSVGRPASAVDLDGLWRVGVFATQFSLTFTDVCSLTIAQTGTALSISGPCEGMANPVALTGAIDPSSGEFTASGSAGICPAITIAGSAASDSASFWASFNCPQFEATGGVNASRCGNGQIDPGETCDDGNRLGGDCCSPSCRLAAVDAKCGDQNNPCAGDTCDAAGQCQEVNLTGPCDDGNSCTAGDTCIDGQCTGISAPDEAPCDDGDACTTGDRCLAGTCTGQPVVCPPCLSCDPMLGCVPAIGDGCKQSAATAIVLTASGTPSVTWRWRNGDATALRELGDPTATTEYDFCVYDGNVDSNGSPRLVLGARAPAGRRWHRAAAGFGYQSWDLAPDGLKRIRLRAGDAGAAQAVAAGEGPNLNLPPLSSITMPVTVQLRARTGGACWSGEYGMAAVRSSVRFAAGTAVPQPDTRPNILLVDLDDTRADGIDRMPTVLSRLAAQGVSFRNSFVIDSLCAPSRATMLTGLENRHHGVEALAGPFGGGRLHELGGDQRTVAVWLQAAGYATGLFGKYINGYDFSSTPQTYRPGLYVPPGWTRWRGMTSNEHYGGIYGGTYTLVDEHGVPTVYDDHATDRHYSTDLLATELRNFIADAAGQGKPFFAVWTPYASHVDSTLVPEPAARHFDFLRGRLPNWRPASWNEMDVTDKPRWVQDIMPAGFGLIILNGADRQEAYESLFSVDENLGLILDDLVQLGIDRDTVILFTSDNGVEWGEHRGFAQAKMCPYEECLRVPLIVRDPRAGASGVVSDATVLNLDLAPTVAALAGVVPPVPTDGVSVTPWLAGSPPAQWRDDFLIENRRSDGGATLTYTGPPADGDQVRVFYGDPRAQPRAAALFEFDNSGGVTAGAVAVPIGASADAAFANLGAAIVAHVPFTAYASGHNMFVVLDNSPNHDGVYVLVERDQAGVIGHQYPIPDYFGVRDVTNGFTYVEYETGEVELYDLSADPAQLDNRADDPFYAATRARLAQRLADLVK